MEDLKRAQALQAELTAWRRYLHRHPETGMALPETSAFVLERLREMGFEPAELPHGGITALAGGKRPGKTVLLRADMDALPMKEESGLPFASCREGIAHTCGHDMHTAALLGAAKLLKEEEDALPGTVKFMFQPGEETLQGAKSMVADGILEQPHVDAAVMMHMAPLLPTGMVFYGSGTVAASSDPFRITVRGKGGHGARPHLSVDPINAAAHIHLSLQELISRETDAADPAVLTIGTFHAGTADNVIPSEAVMTGTLRTYNKKVRDFLLPRMREMVELTAKAFRAEGEFLVTSSVLPLKADPAVVNPAGAAFQRELGGKAVESHEPMCGSEDFAEVTDRVPSLCFLLGGGSREEGFSHGIHHPKVRFQEDSLSYGAAAYVLAATARLTP